MRSASVSLRGVSLATPQVLDCRKLAPGSRTIVLTGTWAAADAPVIEATPQVLGTVAHPINQPTDETDYQSDAWVPYSVDTTVSPVIINTSAFVGLTVSTPSGLANFGAIRVSSVAALEVTLFVSGADA